MSAHTSSDKITATRIRSMKGGGNIVSLTAYTKPMAEMMDPFVDLMLPGQKEKISLSRDTGWALGSPIPFGVDLDGLKVPDERDRGR